MMMVVGAGNKNVVAFTGTLKTSFEQKLVDGNAIHTVKRSHQARDSAGRTMNEMPGGCMLGSDGQMHEIRNISVYDPVARTNSTWQIGNDNQPKVARVFHQPQPMKQPDPDPAELERRQKQMQAAQAQMQQQRKETRTESLGIKDFNGIAAEGTRITRTIPAGKEGNDQPLLVINETWRSKELGLTLMTISDDPRRGRTTTEYEELNRGEPDPALFSPPANYTVMEQPQGGLGGIALD